jgi:hypothetical protein
MIPGKKFNPATETSRRPTPERFEHLREWTEEVKRSVKITNITEMTNINQQLEQNAELYVSNIISRAIAQLIGKYGDGFVTLEATRGGKLKVEADTIAGGTVGLEAGAELIGKVNVVGREHTVLQVAISGSYNGGVELIAANATKKIKIVNIFLVVSSAVSLKFMSDTTNLSGVMELGDTDEPRGMVIPFGNFPMETAVNKNFKLHASAVVDIMGYCNYYLE